METEPVGIICKAALPGVDHTAESVTRWCSVCRTELWVAQSSLRMAARCLNAQYLCTACAPLAMEAYGGEFDLSMGIAGALRQLGWTDQEILAMIQMAMEPASSRQQ